MHIGGHVCRYPRLAGVSRAAGRLRPRDVMTWQAVPGPPVELSHGYAGAAGLPQHGGIAVRALVDDAQPSAWPQHPNHLAQRLRPPGGVPDVADRQAADHRFCAARNRQDQREQLRAERPVLRTLVAGLGALIAVRAYDLALPG